MAACACQFRSWNLACDKQDMGAWQGLRTAAATTAEAATARVAWLACWSARWTGLSPAATTLRGIWTLLWRPSRVCDAECSHGRYWLTTVGREKELSSEEGHLQLFIG